MNLEVDMGNTRLKWRLRDDQGVLTRGSVINEKIQGPESFDGLLSYIDVHQPINVWVSSVSGQHRACFDSWCRQALGIVPRYLEVSRCAAGVINAYTHVEQMGVDRWLAMIAAYSASEDEACLVVDCGSACTIDMILHNGEHLGGYIVPGLRLMKNALFRDTDHVKLESVSESVGLPPGLTTQEAVSSGLWLMLLGAINLSLEHLSQWGRASVYIVFTGGDGEHLSRLFNQQLFASSHNQIVSRVEFKADLVLDGISLLLT